VFSRKPARFSISKTTNGAKGVSVEMSDGDKKSADLQLIQLESKTSEAE
jgi:hypothetical protein